MRAFTRRVGGWWLVPVRLVLLLVVWTPLVACVIAAFWLARLSDAIPEAPALEDIEAPHQSRVHAHDGWHLAGSHAVRTTAYEDLPPIVVASFLAAEDTAFFRHDAFNAAAIVRAVVANLRSGRVVQGASTFTQQLAKWHVGGAKKLERKWIELLLARRIEATYSKPEILHAYLSKAYFGQGAYGITQASWTFFGKPPTALGVGEAAVLASSLPAPTSYNPVRDPEGALERRNRLLDRMSSLGMISSAEVELEKQAALSLAKQQDLSEQRMPYAVATAIRALDAHFDDEAWAKGGYTVVVDHSAIRQARARRSLQAGIEALDRRQGWRGPVGRVSRAEAVDALLEEQQPSDFVLARVVDVDAAAATIITVGGEATLDLEQAKWAAPAERERHFKRPAELEDLGEILEPNDLVLVRREAGNWRLVQTPAFEGAFIDVDSKTGRVLASVGGFDAERSIFHRAEQGCRQPGSVFKPVVYAEALAQGLTAATMLSDLPEKFATGRGTVWQPKNADRDFKGFVTLADALAWSRNIPTVHLMDYLKPVSVVERARQLGIESKLDTTSSVALGASCVRPLEVARVYAAFQRGGRTVELDPIAYIRDADDDILLDRGHFADAGWSTAARLDRMATTAPPAPLGVSREIAHIISHLLRRVVASGTAHELPDEWEVAGKTGTTNDFDAWFVGFDGEQTAVTWIGSDKNTRPLGAGEHGATVALPVFEQFYASYADGAAEFWQREPPARIIRERIDRQSGLRSPSGEPGMELPFIEGTAPDEFAPTRGTRQAEQLDSLTHEF